MIGAPFSTGALMVMLFVSVAMALISSGVLGTGGPEMPVFVSGSMELTLDRP